MSGAWRAAATALALAGCSFVPPYQRPQTPAAPAWSQPADDAAAAPEEWWRAFDSAELNALMAETELRNYDLKAAAARVAQAIAQARATRAALLPAVDAQATAARDYVSNDGGSTRSFDSTFRGQLAASWELDLFGGSRAATLAAVERLAATREDRAALALALHAEVASTYFQYLSLGDRLATARKTIAIARRILELIELRALLGAISGLQVAQQRASA
jgi:outer membrane protein, multidrug efflux system